MVIITRFNINDKVFYWHKSGKFAEGKVSHLIISVVSRFTFSGIISSIIKGFTGMVKNKDDVEDAIHEGMRQDTSVFYYVDGESMIESKLFMDEAEALDSIRIFKKQ